MAIQRKRRNPANEERAKVQQFIVELKRHANVFVFVDTDSEDRHFKSGFDFIVTGRTRSVYVEAKKLKGKEDLEKKYSSFQTYTRAYVLAAGGVYCGLAFLEDSVFLRQYSFDGPDLKWFDYLTPAVQALASLTGAKYDG